MGFALNNVTTADDFANATTLLCPAAQLLILHVRNASAYYELGKGTPMPVWQGAKPILPGTLVLSTRFDALRVKSLKAGTPAQVMADVS
jgi:hypothetical protein